MVEGFEGGDMATVADWNDGSGGGGGDVDIVIDVEFWLTARIPRRHI